MVGNLSGVSATPVPFISTSSMPRYRNEVPMVMTREGMLSRATSAPFTQPQSAPVAKPPSTATHCGSSALTSRQNTAVPSAMMEGKERSISPVMTTKVRASASTPNSGVVWAKAL